MAEKSLQGKVWQFGDDINTDLIVPARYLNTSDPQELATHCMEDVDPEFTKKIARGDIIVAGKNFGCGSSREHAPLAIKSAGIACVIAKSFARIFFRNAINIGLPILESQDTIEEIVTGNVVKIDLAAGKIYDLTTGKTYRATQFPPFMEQLIAAGGLMEWIKQKKMHNTVDCQ
ncbi:3-isopropylmalate dehydratase small subunit [bacterium]|nr:3-isopropylmalate dehydratase small subunit [bacterium]